MGTKIVVMKDGLIQQVGAPLDVFNFPVNQFVAGFIGSPVMNFVPCRITARDGKLFIDTEAFQIAIPEKRKPYYEGLAGKEAVFGIRPNDIYDLAHSPDRIKGNVIKAKVDVVEPLGAVRAGEAGVDRELVHPTAETVDPVTLEIVVSLRVVPEGRFGHGSPFFGCVFPSDHIKLPAELQGNREIHEPGI